MGGKIIQVPIDENLLAKLDDLSRKRGKARAEVIRQACLFYLRQAEAEELDRVYQEGYARIPEEPGTGEAQAAVSGEVVAAEPW